MLEILLAFSGASMLIAGLPRKPINEPHWGLLTIGGGTLLGVGFSVAMGL